MEKWYIDSIDGDYIIVKKGREYFEIPLELIPYARVGQVIEVDVYEVDPRRKRIHDKVKNIFND